MTRQRVPLFLLIIFFLFCLSACSGARLEGEVFSVESGGLDAPADEAGSFEEAEAPAEPVAQAGADGAGEPLRQVAPDAALPRLIIKRGDMAITVADTNQAVQQVTRLATGEGGYVISQQVREQDGFRFASMEFAVPVDQFERTLEILRTFGEVTSETASGEDVTEEFVDLESRLGNLRATQERLRELLAAAENVEEALAVSRELSNIEEELEVVQGRMQYLSERAAFSTIGLTISPVIPTATPTVSPTPRPTLTPTPWRPGETAQEAVDTLGQTTRTVTEGVIYFAIVCGPWLLLLALIGVPVYYLVRRRRSRPDVPGPMEPDLTELAPAEPAARNMAPVVSSDVQEAAAPDDQLNEEVD